MNAKDHKHHMVVGQPVEVHSAIAGYEKVNSPKEQFMAVVEYLCANQSFSTVDDIFDELSSRIPNVTKTIINKALDALAETGVIDVIRIDSQMELNAPPVPHAHFVCSKCGSMQEVPLAFDVNHALMLPNGAKVDDSQIMCLGVCSRCHSSKGVN